MGIVPSSSAYRKTREAPASDKPHPLISRILYKQRDLDS
jgi:hypothetical protein